MTITIHTPERPVFDTDLLRRWGAVSTTIIADLFAGRVLADPLIRPLRRMAPGPRLVGRALTVRCEPPDFGAVLHAIDRSEPGDVLVIAADGFRAAAMIGDILSGVARHRGVAGVVCDGAVRDIGVLAGWSDFPVFTRSNIARGPSSKASGSVNGPVIIGGVEVGPGALVVGDDDGLVFLAPEDAVAFINEAERRSEAEGGWVERLQAGERLCAVFNVPDAQKAAE